MRNWFLVNFFQPILADLKCIISQNGDIKSDLAKLRQDVNLLRVDQSKKNHQAAAESDSPELLGRRFGLDPKTSEQVDWSRVK